jgi:hypothetical protein
MRAIEHIHADGTSSFQYTECTHGEWRALQAMEASTPDPKAREAWIRINCTIDEIHVAEAKPEPADDEWFIAPRRR